MKNRIIGAAVVIAMIAFLLIGCGESPSSSGAFIITEVIVEPSYILVSKGGSQTFSATVYGENDPPQTVTWSIDQAVSAGTTINSAGLLTVAADETLESFTVRATSTADTSKSGQATAAVSGDIIVPNHVTGNMGTYDFGYNEDNTRNYRQAVWVFSAANASTLKSATQIAFVLGTDPSAGMQFSWRGSAAGNWNSTNILSASGAAQNGASWDAVTKTLTINLETAVNDRTSFLAQSGGIQIAVVYSGFDNINDLGIESAKLLDSGGEEVEIVPTITSVTVNLQTGVQISRGESVMVSATVNGVGEVAQTVTWSIDETGKHADTNITPFNDSYVLNVSPYETLSTLTVRATSTVDTTKSGTAVVNITGDIALGITPSSVNVFRGMTRQFNLTGSPAQAITWSIDAAQDLHAGTTISSTGLLTVSINEQNSSFDVKVTSNGDDSIDCSAYVTISNGWAIESINVSIAPDSPNKTWIRKQGRQIKLTADVVTSGTLPDGYNPNDDIIWEIDPGYSTISQSGLITINRQDLGTSRGYGDMDEPDCAFNRTGTADFGCWGHRTYTENGRTFHRLEYKNVRVSFGRYDSGTEADRWHFWQGPYTAELRMHVIHDGDNVLYEGRGPQKYIEVTSAGTINLTGLNMNNVYLAYINPTNNVAESNSGTISISGPAASMSRSISNNASSAQKEQPGKTSVIPVSGTPEATAFNALPAGPGAGKRAQVSRQAARSIAPLSLVVGTSTREFFNRYDQKLTATLLATGTHSNIWVPNSFITSAQAQSIAAKFDILYPVVTNVFGFENGGGPEGDGGMDGDKKIQILIYQEGGSNVVGYFGGRDLHPTNVQPTSNEAEMFYMNASYFGDEEFFYTTLAHEHQHMINYTRKNIEKGLPSPVWYNELLSAMTEEIVHPFLNPDGLSRPTRIGHYFSSEMFLLPMTQWDSEYNTQSYYNRASAFGGYLLRNYGGAKLARAISLNDTVGMESIEAAIAEVGAAEPDFYTRFIEALIFNKSDEAALGKSLKTFSNSSTETINGITYNFPGFDTDEYIRQKFSQFFFYYGSSTKWNTLQPYSQEVVQPEALRCVTGNFSITVTPPTGGARLFIIVR